jgi:hypothetical protein
MNGKNSEKDVWLTYCEECVMSKIDKNVPQEYKEEPRENADTPL